MRTHCGCKIYRGQEVFTCHAKACTKERLCIGCVWTCADCGDDLCEDHVIDLKDAEEPTRYSVYVCYPCQARRQERKAA